MQPLSVPQSIFSYIHIDFIIGLPKSSDFEVILVVVERLTKYDHFVPLKDSYITAIVAQTFVDQIYRLHGLPRNIMSERDSVFISTFWQELWLFKQLGTSLCMPSTYHPQIVVVNCHMETYLRCMAEERSSTCAKWLPLAEWQYNMSLHSTIWMTIQGAIRVGNTPLHVISFKRLQCRGGKLDAERLGGKH